MILSMTGYGKSSVQINGINIETEVKSLNSRFLDLSLRLPKSLSNKEYEIREKIKQRIKRGKLSVNILIKREVNDSDSKVVDEVGLNAAVNLLNNIKTSSKASGEISIDNLLNFQSMFITEFKLDPEKEFHIVEESIFKAIEELEIMKQKEGAELAKDLHERLDVITKSVEVVESSINGELKSYFEKLKDRAKQLLEDFPETNERLDMELALLTERYDITEECVRLKSHIKMFTEALTDSKETGRRLNFLCQEMNREANTINSKSISTSISYEGISIKEQLEKIREQIQNIE